MTEDGGRGGFRLMLEAIRPHRSWTVLAIVFGIGWTASKVAVPSLAERAIDRGIVPGDGSQLLHWAAVMVAVGLVQAATTGLRRYCAFRVSLQAEADLRHRLFAHLQRLPFAFHDRSHTGELMSRANTDLQQIQFFLVFIPITIANILTVLSITAVLVVKDPGLALLALAALPFLNVAAAVFNRRLHPVVLGLQERLAGVAGVVEETVAGVRVVKGFGAERLQQRRLDEAAADVFTQSMAAARLRANFMPFLELLPVLGLVAILWMGGHQVIDGDLSVGEFVAFNTYVLMMVWPLRMTGLLIAQSSRASASAGRVREILSTAPTIVDHPDARPLPPGRGEVRFEGVEFAYAPGQPVLAGLDLVVRAGEAVALVGATGSGKSTVARLLPRFYDVDGGAVLLDGADVREVRLEELRRAVGIVFEETFLFSDTVNANIAFAHPDASEERVRRAAELAGAAEFVERLPHGYDTVLGEHGYSLSGGQRQRIAIARAVLADPRVLVLDDATSSVDPTKEHGIRAALEVVMRGRTTIIIAHRPATIALADRVVLLDGGRVAAEGTHEELLASSERYREVLARAVEEEQERFGAAVEEGEPS